MLNDDGKDTHALFYTCERECLLFFKIYLIKVNLESLEFTIQ